MTAPALSLREVSISRAETPVVHGVSLDVAPAEITVLLGANGAGKTTLMDGIAGLIRTSAGTVTLAGDPIDRLPTHRRAAAGLAYVEQARSVFRTLTVEQNLLVAQRGDADLDTAYRLFPELAKRRTLQAGHLSGGEQQMLVLGRALVAQPKTVLIDEMSSGLAPVVVHRLMRAVADLVELGIAVLLIEQFAHLALEIGTRAYVLAKGRLVFDGPCAELRGDTERLHDFYFGRTSEGALAGAPATDQAGSEGA
ncbi:ABC transporter ATP-binding protein [Kitasatospora sp. NPDC101183]|uniref:ABC transporter ATP-binding protein n=1 Tax=Kitasatospora sp. NPDC101183 TaxID=3364100 RepID=UPI0037FCFF8E